MEMSTFPIIQHVGESLETIHSEGTGDVQWMSSKENNLVIIIKSKMSRLEG